MFLSEMPSEEDSDSPFSDGVPDISAEGISVLDGSAPWRSPELMPEKPPGFLYGVQFKNHPQHGDAPVPFGSTAELLAVIREESQRIDKVFLPGQDRGVPLRSLNLFRALERKDLQGFFLGVLRTRGLIGVASLAGAFLFQSSWAPLLFIIGLLYGLVPTFDALIQWLLFPKGKSQAELKQSLVHGAVFNDWIQSSRRSRLSIWVMVGIFVIVFIAQLQEGLTGYQEITERGVIKGRDVRIEGEWWRLFTAPLMHSSLILHIIFNSLALVYLGRFVHRLAHPLLIPIIFVISAFVGSVASTLTMREIGSLGASGGVVGLLGFLLFLILARPGVFPYEFRTLSIRNLILLGVIGLAGFGFIDNAGHGGGLVGGFLCGMVYQRFHRSQWDVPNSPVKTVLGILSFGVLLFGFAVCIDLFFFEGNFVKSHFPLLPW